MRLYDRGSRQAACPSPRSLSLSAQMLRALRPAAAGCRRLSRRRCTRCAVSEPAAPPLPASLPRSVDGRVSLLGLRRSALAGWLGEMGEAPSRAPQLFAELYRNAAGDDLQAFTAVSASFRARLAPLVDCRADLRLSEVVAAADGTRKLLFTLTDGGGTVEAVLIPARNGSRTTLCVSSQLGCAMNCQFCATARMGLRRNLSAAQIVGQVLAAKRLLLSERGGASIGNVVFMGMGEPLHNADEVLTAVDILLDNTGLAFSHNRVTVSTSGLVPAIRRFVTESSASLAVSLNATTDEVRSWIMPVNRKHDLAELLGTLRELYGSEVAPPHRRRDSVFFEYVLLQGVNDSDDDAHRLVEIARSGIPCKVNLISFNAHQGTQFKPSSQARLLFFRDTLAKAGVTATIRESRGDDQMAACGQLGKPEEAALWKPQPPRMKPPARLRETEQ